MAETTAPAVAAAAASSGLEVASEAAPAAATSHHFSKRILVAVDGSEHSLRALQFACENLVGEDVLLVILHVRPHFDESDFYSEHSYNLEFNERLLKESRNLLDGLASQAKGFKVGQLPDDSIRKVSVSGDARTKILEAAETVKPTMIVVASHGKGALSRTFVGSVSDYLVHHSPYPVLVVRPPPEAHSGLSLPGFGKLGKVVESAQ